MAVGVSGTLEVEAGVKLAREATGRPMILTFYGQYHGEGSELYYIGSRMLLRRRIRRLLIARLVKARSEADEDFDDDLDEDDEDIGEEGSDRDRKFMRLLVASRVLRRRRVRRALIAKLLKERSESEDDYDDVDEDDTDDESPDVERQLARLLVGGRVVRRRRARRAALVRFLRNRD